LERCREAGKNDDEVCAIATHAVTWQEIEIDRDCMIVFVSSRGPE